MNMELHCMTITADRRDLDQQAARGWMVAEAGRKHRSCHPVVDSLRQAGAATGAALAWIGTLINNSREDLHSREQQLAAYGVSWVADPIHDAELAQELKTARERRHAGVVATPPVQATTPAIVHIGIRVVIGAALVQAGQRLQGRASIEVAPEAQA